MDEIISTERLREIQSVDSDGTLLRELIDYFSEEVPRELEKTRRAVARQDKEVVRRSIHKLKSLFANVGAEEGARICAGCEQILANEFDSKAVLEALRRLEESYPLVLEELIQWTNFHP